MNRREFFKSAAMLAAVTGISGPKAMAQAKPKACNNQIWLMTSAFPGDRGFDDVVARAKAVGAQGLLFGAVSLRKVTGDVSRSFRLQKAGDAGISGQILDAAERLFPRRIVGLEREATKGHEHCHQNFLHLLTVLSFYSLLFSLHP